LNPVSSSSNTESKGIEDKDDKQKIKEEKENNQREENQREIESFITNSMLISLAFLLFIRVHIPYSHIALFSYLTHYRVVRELGGKELNDSLEGKC
jgi:hypothetical protein